MLQFDWEVFGRCCLLTVAGGGRGGLTSSREAMPLPRQRPCMFPVGGIIQHSSTKGVLKQTKGILDDSEYSDSGYSEHLMTLN